MFNKNDEDNKVEKMIKIKKGEEENENKYDEKKKWSFKNKETNFGARKILRRNQKNLLWS